MNIELTKNNHMVWGYNDIPWSNRSCLYDRFFINYGKSQNHYKSFREACIDTAKELSEKAQSLGKRPLIYYSGGIDSESIIAAFLESGNDFSIVHIRYVPDYNNHEYKFVDKFVRKHNLDLIEYQVNPIDFLKSDKCFSLAIRDNARLIETHLLTSITEFIRDKFFPILDHPGTMLFRKNKDLSQPGDWHWKDFEHIMFYYNHCVNEKMHACPSFYHWSPEIILSFLLDPIIKDLVSDKIYGKVTNRTSTLNLYLSAFPEYSFEPRMKFGGFEFIPKSLIHSLNNRLNKKTFYDRHSGQEYAYKEILKILGYNDNTAR